MGRKLANRPERDCDCRPSKRPDRFRRDVRASMGMLSRDMVLDCCGGGGSSGCDGVLESRRFA